MDLCRECKEVLKRVEKAESELAKIKLILVVIGKDKYKEIFSKTTKQMISPVKKNKGNERVK